MAADDEWNAPEPVERLPVKPEQQERFSRLLTELMFGLAGAPIFGFSAAWIRPPLRMSSSSWSSLPPRPEWEVQFYLWTPLVLGLLAFGCLVWAVLVLLRMAELKKEGA